MFLGIGPTKTLCFIFHMKTKSPLPIQRVFSFTALHLLSFPYLSWSTSCYSLRDGFPASFIPSRQYLHSKSQLKEHFLKSVVNIFHQVFLTNIQSNYPAPCLFHLTMHFERRSSWRMLYSMLSSDQLVARLHSVCTLRKPQMRRLKSFFLSIWDFSRSHHVFLSYQLLDTTITSAVIPSKIVAFFANTSTTDVRILQTKKL